MRPYLHRLIGGLVASAAVPVSVRGVLLRHLGYEFGARLRMHSGAHLGSTLIRLGDGVFINHDLFYDGDAAVTVGNEVAFGPDVRLITATHEIGPPARRCDPRPLSKPIVIEDGCWIAAGVTILPGVTIARGCVIAAGSVVTRSTTPDGLYANTPARRLRDLSRRCPAGRDV